MCRLAVRSGKIQPDRDLHLPSRLTDCRLLPAPKADIRFSRCSSDKGPLSDRPISARTSGNPTSRKHAVRAAFRAGSSDTGIEVQLSESLLSCGLFVGLAGFEGRCIPGRAFVITAALVRFSRGFRYRLWSWFKCHECSPFWSKTISLRSASDAGLGHGNTI